MRSRRPAGRMRCPRRSVRRDPRRPARWRARADPAERPQRDLGSKRRRPPVRGTGSLKWRWRPCIRGLTAATLRVNTDRSSLPRSGGFRGNGGGGRRAGRRWLPGAREPQLLGALCRLGPVADTELAVERRGVVLDGVRGEEEPLGDLAVGRPLADQLEDLALAGGERHRRPLGLAREDGHPAADHADRVGHLLGAPVLGDEAGRAGGLRRLRRDPAGAGDQQNAGLRRGVAERLAEIRTGALPEEEVHERDVGLQATGELDGLVGSAGGLAAPDPWLAAEQQAEAPLHDAVVVDDEHLEAARAVQPLGSTRRIRHWSSSRPYSSIPPRWSASYDASRRPIREPRTSASAAGGSPSFRTSRANTPSGAAIDTFTSLGSACFSALRRASFRTDTARGSSRSGTSAPSAHSSWSGRFLYWRSRRSSSARRLPSSISKTEPPGDPIRASRRSPSAASISAAALRRSSSASGTSEPSASEIPNSRWVTRSWTSRARSIRSESRRLRSSCRVTSRTWLASAAVRPRASIVERSVSVRSKGSPSRSAKITPSQRPAAATGVQVSLVTPGTFR